MNVVSNGMISLGVIFLFIQMSQMLFRPLRQIADKFNSLQMGMVAAERIFRILETNSNIKNSGSLIPKSIQGKISFEKLKFSYVPGEIVIENFSLDIRKGERIAIVGATGSGKSTIINLLCRFYDFKYGDILIDDISIKNFDLFSLRNHISLVLQDVFLFADSLYNNITLFNEKIRRDKVINASKELGIHEFIESLPGGYNYNVKERGIMLSAGQRQLIAFLRAYLIEPSILVLDEATSSVDSYTEDSIQRAIKTITNGKTSIIIAHRLTTIMNADKIVVLENGKIVEQGAHEELIKVSGGHYSNLYEVQFSKELSSV